MSMASVKKIYTVDCKNDIQSQKKLLVNNIKYLFEQNRNMACYSMFLNEMMFDMIFETYLKKYLNKIELDDKETIRNMLENILQIKLTDYMNDFELNEMHIYSKNYIELLI